MAHIMARIILRMNILYSDNFLFSLHSVFSYGILLVSEET